MACRCRRQGGWLPSYHQENADPAARDTMFTNRGVMRCIADQVPVGVLREVAPASHRSRYDVLGLLSMSLWVSGTAIQRLLQDAGLLRV